MAGTTIGVNLTERSTTPRFQLGETFYDEVGGTLYEYVLATGTRAIGDLCGIDKSGNLTAAVTYAGMGSGANPYKLGVPQSVAFANGQYGWVARQGAMNVNVLASAVAEAKLYTSATAGSVDDAATTQSLINGLTVNATVGGSAALSACTARLPLTANCYA